MQILKPMLNCAKDLNRLKHQKLFFDNFENPIKCLDNIAPLSQKCQLKKYNETYPDILGQV